MQDGPKVTLGSWLPNNSIEPTWPAGSRCQRTLIDSSLPASVSLT